MRIALLVLGIGCLAISVLDVAIQQFPSALIPGLINLWFYKIFDEVTL